MSDALRSIFYYLDGNDVAKAEELAHFEIPNDAKLATVFNVQTKRTLIVFVERRDPDDRGPARWNLTIMPSGDLTVSHRTVGQATHESGEFTVALAAGVWRSIDRGGIRLAGPAYD